MKFKFHKIIRYGILFPLDLLRSFPFLISCFFLPTTNPILLAKRLLILFLYKKPTEERVNQLSEILKKSNGCNWKCVLSFFMFPESIETRIFQGWNNLLSHHHARCFLVQNHLPSAKIIIDLGGSGAGVPGGGLLHMGYPHKPEKIVIVDLPPDVQFWKHTPPLPGAHPFVGTEVLYNYDGMSNLSAFEDKSIDLVWSGQSIEHVPQDVARKTMQEVFRVLKPGGFFCLDTPNRRVTKILARVGYVHPEHFYEYEPQELADICCEYGFVMQELKSVSPVPFSKNINYFCKFEVKANVEIGNDFENGYSFYLKLMKPLK
jgi:hypothetical protein